MVKNVNASCLFLDLTSNQVALVPKITRLLKGTRIMFIEDTRDGLCAVSADIFLEHFSIVARLQVLDQK